MSGRHDSQLGEGGWAPTAFRAVVACTPTTSLFAALGLAGGGYLTGREDVAACGAVAGAFGLVVERFQTRSVRLRLRRERARYRDEVRGFSRDLHEVQRQLSALRADLDDVRAQRDAARERLSSALGELTDVRATAAAAAAAPAAAAPAVGDQAVGDQAVGDQAVAPLPAVALGRLVPAQARSPIATGGIPVPRPGPGAPVQVIDIAPGDPITRPLDILPGRPPEPRQTATPPARLVDALVYAGLVEAETDDLPRVLEVARHWAGSRAGSLHTGHAHRAGDYARADAQTAGPPVLYVVNRSRQVA
ncbi:MAG TPA: hypothetical protein VI248_14900 [Kineosporiaceae bacterium]